MTAITNSFANNKLLKPLKCSIELSIVCNPQFAKFQQLDQHRLTGECSSLKQTNRARHNLKPTRSSKTQTYLFQALIVLVATVKYDKKLHIVS